MATELVLLAALTFLAMASAVWRLFFQPSGRRFGVFGLLLVLLASILGAGNRYRTKHHPTPEGLVKNRPIELPKQNYVRSDTCQACHPGEYHSWFHSFHRTMTQLADKDSIVAPFDGTQPGAYTPHIVHQDGGNFWVEVEDERNRVSLVTGSHHMQIYWLEDDPDSRHLRMFDYAWRIPEQTWMPISAAFLTPPTLLQETGGGRWNKNCFRCHSTGPEPRIESPELMDTRVSEFGIACEACHGPAEEHIQANQNPLRRMQMRAQGQDDSTIVNPGKLDPARSADVCGQCHGTLYFTRQEDRERHKREGSWFRPGNALTDVHQIQGEGEDRFWDDGVVRVAGREYNGLLQSPCFNHGDPERGIMTCTTCHSMHQAEGDRRPIREWAEDQLLPGIRGEDQVCLDCHEHLQDPDALRRHSHHEPASSGSRCYNCHMPHSSYGLLKATRSHTIANPSVAESVEVGRPNACNLCHLDRTLRWTADHLTDWYGEPPAETLRAGAGLTEDEENYAAGVLWLLNGDAGQRALLAWACAWPPAREASATHWMAPLLAPLLNDDYHALRFLAYRTLKTLPSFENLEYDFLSPKRDRPEVMQKVWDQWHQWAEVNQRPANETLLISARGLRLKEMWRLRREKDETPVMLAE